MAEAKTPLPTKLIIGILYVNKDYLKKSLKILEEKYGKIDYESQEIDFSFTNYYADEMAETLYRKFISFEELIDPGRLGEIKLQTNNIEEIFLENSKRMINLDPGYMTEAKFVLASAKNFQHRIYLGKGIFAELEFRWQKGEWTHLEWTYPDYRTKEYKKIFKDMRIILRKQIQKYKK